MRKALVVLSGGQDSTTCLYWAIERFGKENVWAIGFDYGQRHKTELICAREICNSEGIGYEVIPTPVINQLSANSLTREDIPVEAEKPEGAPPNTFVDGRNHLFLSYAAIYAKTHGITDIVTGVCETDFLLEIFFFFFLCFFSIFLLLQVLTCHGSWSSFIFKPGMQFGCSHYIMSNHSNLASLSCLL